jgi:hypothetical protein
MNKSRIKHCMGHRIQLVPATLHLDVDSDGILAGEEFWMVQAMPSEHIELGSHCTHRALSQPLWAAHFTGGVL